MTVKQTISAGGIVVDRRGLVLVVAQQGGLSWSLPKGHIDDGEDAETATIREIEEESGISDAKIVRGVGTYQRYKLADDGSDDTSELKTLIIFLCTTNEATLQPIDPENTEAMWVEPDEVSKILTHPKDKAFFEQQKEQILQFIASRPGVTFVNK